MCVWFSRNLTSSIQEYWAPFLHLGIKFLLTQDKGSVFNSMRTELAFETTIWIHYTLGYICMYMYIHKPLSILNLDSLFWAHHPVSLNRDSRTVLKIWNHIIILLYLGSFGLLACFSWTKNPAIPPGPELRYWHMNTADVIMGDIRTCIWY